MEPKRLTTRAMLQRVVTLTKHAHELQSSMNLTVPLGANGWHRQASTNSDLGQGSTSNGTNQSPRSIPTYALGPANKFDFSRAQRLLQSELNRRCSRVSKILRYDPKQSLDLARDASLQLRRALKSDMSNNTRFKIVVITTIVQTAPGRQIHQSMSIASRCLWDLETDGSITVQANVGYDMSATATAFAVYTE